MIKIINGKDVEFIVLKYRLEDGIVIMSSTDMIDHEEGYGVCLTTGVNIGDEELNFITVQSVDADSLVLTSATSVIAPPSARFLLRENKNLKQQLAEAQAQLTSEEANQAELSATLTAMLELLAV